jgi:hypothetical protein
MMPRRFLTVLAFGLAVAVVAAKGDFRNRMYPQFLLIRGPGLEKPVAFSHAGANVASLAADTIVQLYTTLVRYQPRSEAELRRRRYFEVAEFIGTQLVVHYAPDGRSLAQVPVWEGASRTSRIYVGRDSEPPLWENPATVPGGARAGFYALSNSAQKLLDVRGIRLR